MSGEFGDEDTPTDAELMLKLRAASEGGCAVIAWESLTLYQQRIIQTLAGVKTNDIPLGEKVWGIRNELIMRIFDNGGVFVTVFPNPDAIPEEQDIY